MIVRIFHFKWFNNRRHYYIMSEEVDKAIPTKEDLIDSGSNCDISV